MITTLSPEIRIKMLNNRIRILTARGETMNIGIINKLKRQIRALQNA